MAQKILLTLACACVAPIFALCFLAVFGMDFTPNQFCAAVVLMFLSMAPAAAAGEVGE